ncbi:glycosyltransferase family 4 protein [Hymenobacter canadensis]|uniref:Glycosyltransferase family 4 protein n=1 Tax=Hymenobacter canadensis TaxID=2999067 RepID=A0ABY7LPP1_9BACT|nr:glycosyltransferase family 4 protein [Hymenobacter canadensis]WBA42392.1 glycosyltransferase family 4 protein [Hymenobacter canadensis]
MKVIHLILGKANPERMNGVNKVVHAMATQQQRAGWDVEVWGITRDVEAGHPHHEFLTRLFQAQRTPFQLSRQLLAALAAVQGPAVVHLHGGFVPAYFSAARQMKALGLPYVLTPHGSYSTQAMRKNGLVKRVYLSVCEQFVLQNAAQVHCLGQSEVQGLQRRLPGLSPCLLPYGYEVNPTETTWPRTASAEVFRVGFCGRLDDNHKGLHCLITGFGEFARTRPDAELWIIGDGPDRARVENWASAVPAGTVHVLGSRFGAEKLALLSQLDVFAHTSHYEGLPTAVLEAAALGIPCVVTEATNLGSYVRQYACGQVLPEAKPTQLAMSLQQMHQQWRNTPRQQRGLRSQHMVATAFAWPQLLTQYHSMYQRACHA